MSKTATSNSIEINTSPAIAIPNGIGGYGRVAGIDSASARPALPKESLGDLFKFYYGEYITGILFVLALSIYTIVMPEKVINPLKYFYGMVDKICKKVLDIGGSIIGLILTIPIFIVIPILIKLTSRGPVFYTQDRIGKNLRRRNRRLFNSEMDNNCRIRDRRREDYKGRTFRVIKFRTMVHNAEASTGAVWAAQNDSRVTSIGRFLRKSRIDELPQLLNVLAGDMSLVGPRPERPIFVKNLTEKVPNYNVRLAVKPGITGLAQVSSGYDSSLESVINKVNYDVEYIRNWSILSDIKILFRTVSVVLTGRGAC